MDEKPHTTDYLSKTLRLAHQLLLFADEGEARAEDDGCRILFGLIRDCAYRIQTEAQEEQKAHNNNASKGTPEHSGTSEREGAR